MSTSNAQYCEDWAILNALFECYINAHIWFQNKFITYVGSTHHVTSYFWWGGGIEIEHLHKRGGVEIKKTHCYLYVVHQICSIQNDKTWLRWLHLVWNTFPRKQLGRWFKHYDKNVILWDKVLMGIQTSFVTMTLLSGTLLCQRLLWRRSRLMFVFTVYEELVHRAWFKLLRKMEL